MSPISSNASGSLTQLREERMPGSHMFDDVTDGLPKRAYSVGSNPVKAKHDVQGYVDMTGE